MDEEKKSIEFIGYSFPVGDHTSARIAMVDLTDHKSVSTPPFGIDPYTHKSSSPDWSAGCIIGGVSDYADLYRKSIDEQKHQKSLMNFPETRGPELTFSQQEFEKGIHSGRLNFEETRDGLLSRIRELTQTKAGGVEPPAFITAKDMANELESLPKSFVEAALDPEETGEVEIILGELKRQGDEVAVTLERKEEFDDLNLLKMGIDPALDFPGLGLKPFNINLSKDDFGQFLLDESRSLMFKDPGIFMDVDMIPKTFLGGGLIP